MGNLWYAGIEATIKDAVALLAVCSPTYLERPFCHRECEIFRDHHGASEDPRPLKDRLLKVIKTPSLDGAHLDFFSEVQHLEFFGKTGDEYPPKSAEFESRG
jgi:hypothetical protein